MMQIELHKVMGIFHLRYYYSHIKAIIKMMQKIIGLMELKITMISMKRSITIHLKRFLKSSNIKRILHNQSKNLKVIVAVKMSNKLIKKKKII